MDVFAALDATWPAAETRITEGWLIRRGDGGGQRVSAARRVTAGAEVAVAEGAMRALGQAPLFQVLPGQDDLVAELGARGYRPHDPTVILETEIAALALPACDERTIFCDGPLAVMAAIWSAGGIGPERLAVMARATGPKTWLMGRLGDRPSGCAFVALAGDTAMLHALEIDPAARRNGLGARLTRAAATFGARRGATRLALAVTAANAPARALYEGLGMAEISRYHYRVAP
jgi:GNAT superfamily N-acetyltransferase